MIKTRAGCGLWRQNDQTPQSQDGQQKGTIPNKLRGHRNLFSCARKCDNDVGNQWKLGCERTNEWIHYLLQVHCPLMNWDER